MLKIEIRKNGKLILKNEEETSLLLRYLCFKVFKDDETKELESIQDNYFYPEIEVVVNSSGKNKLSSKQFTLLKEYVDEN